MKLNQGLAKSSKRLYSVESYTKKPLLIFHFSFSFIYYHLQLFNYAKKQSVISKLFLKKVYLLIFH